jgi:hypothetical protein
MLGTFRKHSTWLWGIIIVAMAISLVYWTGNRGDRGDGGGTANFGSISGRKITPEEFFNARDEALLEYFFSRGEWPDTDAKQTGFDIERETYFRLFLNSKQEEMGIHVGSDDVARFAAQVLRNFQKDGGNGVELFTKNVLAPRGLTMGDFESFLRHSIGMQQLSAAVGVSGQLVTAQDVRALYERENQDLSAQVVFFNASNYLAGIAATPAALSEFYSNQIPRYRLPERVQVGYVQFEATNFWAEAAAQMDKLTNLTAMIDAEYKKRGTNFYADVTPEKAKESIKAEYQQQLALRAARQSAAEFADKLFGMEPVQAGNLAALAKEKGLVTAVTAPFDRSSAPEGLDVAENFTRAAYALRADEPFAGPIVGAKAVFIIAQNRQLPSEVPPFKDVAARVEKDFTMSRATQAARAVGIAFAQNATNALATGKAFTSLCADAKVKPVLLPPFSLSTRALAEVEDHISLQQFKQVAFSTTVGKCSPFVPTMEGGMVVYAQAKLPLDEAMVTAGLPEFAKLVRQARQSEAFQEWFSREVQQALVDTPVLRPRPSQLNTSSGTPPAAN